jgi:queuine/archaeosine tRNA-ribosyltransferase
MLLSIHNVFFYLEWMKRIREAIGRGDLASVEAPPERKIDSA